MDSVLRGIAEKQCGVFLRRQALACGYSSRDVQAMVRAGAWKRIRSGAYMDTSLAITLDRVELYVARIRAVMLQLVRTAVVTHTSAVALHGLPLWDVNLANVHVSRSGTGGRVRAGIQHHRPAIPPDDVTRCDDMFVTNVARTVVDVAGIVPYEAAVVIVDAALVAGATTRGELLAMVDRIRQCPRSRRAVRAVEDADGLAESPGETRLRLLMRAERLPAPEPQVDIVDEDGVFVGRVDFLQRDYDAVIEFDGMYKFGLGPGTPGEKLAKEKEREDRIRELGYEVVRVVWAELSDPKRVAARIRAAMERAKKRRRG